MKYYMALFLIFFSTFSSADTDGYTYKIIQESSIPKIKHSLEISLDKKITKNQLTTLAKELKGDVEYERTFIGYVINKDKVSNGYWATTHFNPELDVKILGLTIDQEEEMRTKSDIGEGKKLISSWIDDRPYVGAKITIYEDNEKFYMTSLYEDKSSSTKEMKITKKGSGRKVETIEKNGFGEYFLINGEGALEFWSSTRNYYTAKELK